MSQLLPSGEQLNRIRAVVDQQPSVEANLALMGDKQVLFSTQGNAFMYVLTLVMFGPDAPAETISHGRFEKLTLVRPQGEAKQLVLFFSGERGWTADLEPIAQSLSRQGALVAGIDTPAFFRNLQSDGGDCVSPDGDLENLSHFIQAYYRSATYRPAILLGYASGASFVYAMLAQAPPGTFAGGISLGFCPTLALTKPLCQSGRLKTAANKSGTVELQPVPKLAAPWLVMQGMNGSACLAPAKQFIAKVKDAESVVVPGDTYGQGDFHTWESQFAASFQKLAAQVPALPSVSAAELKDLPLIEVKSHGAGDTLAVLISGDGGWAGIDKELAAALSKQGMSVVGLALSQTAVFEFHLQNWLGGDKGAVPVAPELWEMKGVRTLCVYGEDEEDSLCGMPATEQLQAQELSKELPKKLPGELQIIKLRGGHHFDGNYANLAALILARMR